MTITTPPDKLQTNAGLQIVVFDDQEDSWPIVYGNNSACPTKLIQSKRVM
jgi:hypothetical protein